MSSLGDAVENIKEIWKRDLHAVIVADGSAALSFKLRLFCFRSGTRKTRTVKEPAAAAALPTPKRASSTVCKAQEGQIRPVKPPPSECGPAAGCILGGQAVRYRPGPELMLEIPDWNFGSNSSRKRT